MAQSNRVQNRMDLSNATTAGSPKTRRGRGRRFGTSCELCIQLSHENVSWSGRGEPQSERRSHDSHKKPYSCRPNCRNVFGASRSCVPLAPYAFEFCTRQKWLRRNGPKNIARAVRSVNSISRGSQVWNCRVDLPWQYNDYAPLVSLRLSSQFSYHYFGSHLRRKVCFVLCLFHDTVVQM